MALTLPAKRSDCNCVASPRVAASITEVFFTLLLVGVAADDDVDGADGQPKGVGSVFDGDDCFWRLKAACSCITDDGEVACFFRLTASCGCEVDGEVTWCLKAGCSCVTGDGEVARFSRLTASCGCEAICLGCEVDGEVMTGCGVDEEA